MALVVQCFPVKTSPGQNVPRLKRPQVKTSPTRVKTSPTRVKTSPGQNVPRSKRPQVKTSPGQNVPRSKRPQVKTSPGQNVPRSKRPQVKTYPGQNVPRSKRTQVKTYPGQNIPNSVLAPDISRRRGYVPRQGAMQIFSWLSVQYILTFYILKVIQLCLHDAFFIKCTNQYITGLIYYGTHILRDS
jgi:hypothetical protein